MSLRRTLALLPAAVLLPALAPAAARAASASKRCQGMRGWSCKGPSSNRTYIRYRCSIRTSFGGTTAERRHRLEWRVDSP